MIHRSSETIAAELRRVIRLANSPFTGRGHTWEVLETKRRVLQSELAEAIERENQVQLNLFTNVRVVCNNTILPGGES